MYAILGKVEFDLITYFDGLEAQFGADYAEHALIGRKPRLQHVGDKLDEINIDLVFHVNYCNPDAELARLRDAMASHEAMALVLGNGDFKGRFVITSLSATGRHTDTTGTMLALEAKMALRESPGDPAAPPAPAVRQAGSAAGLPVKGALVKALPESVKTAVAGASGLAKAVSAAKGALASAGKVVAAVKAVQGLAGSSPLEAMAGLPGVVSSIGAALPQLEGAATHLARLGAVAGEVAAVGRTISEVQSNVSGLAATLKGANPGNILSKLTSAIGPASNIGSAILASGAPLARLTAQVITRRG
ncbi:MAG: phage tail protein [Duganella sp.]